MKTKILVNRHNIKYNQNHKDKRPVLSCKTYKDNTYANEIQINGPCRIIYSPDKPLSCGATVWVETQSEVIKIK